MLPDHKVLRAYFYDQNRSLINCELENLKTNEIIEYTVSNDPDDYDYNELIKVYPLDEIHQQTFKYIRDTQTDIKRIAIEVAKRNGWLLSDVTVNDDIAELEENRNQKPTEDSLAKKERELRDLEYNLRQLEHNVNADRKDVEAKRKDVEAKRKDVEAKREDVKQRKAKLAKSQQENKEWQENLRFKERELTSKENDVNTQPHTAPNIEEVLLLYVFNTNVNPEFIFNLKLKLFDLDFVKQCSDRSLKKELRIAKSPDEVIKAAINIYQFKDLSDQS